ncbi:MAG: choice-of-anchor L domain-containing protein [Flavobacteriales bacterium]
MNMRIASLAASFLTVLFAAPLNAQLAIDNSQTPLQLLENVLLGEGVTVSNVTFNGGDATLLNEQAGSFTGAEGSIGLGSGIILSSGNVEVALGPNDAGGSTLGGGNFGFGDPDLETLAGVTTNDASILEFDFIPVGDSITFRYVFASEEYNEYVCGTVNDVFGFFLSGPGLSGPFTDGAVNLALVPGTSVPVSINTVNNGTVGANGQLQNCLDLDANWIANNIYYIDNGASIEVQFDGQTVVLTARAEVVCGQTYHIKMAIADGGDTAFDSGVFLEAGSFTSVPFIPSLTPGPGIVGENTILESCYPVTIDFIQQDGGADTNVVIITVGGSATPGVDFSPNFPDSLVFLPGDTVQSFTFNCPIDTDSTENIILTLVSQSICSGVQIVNQFEFFIESAAPLVSIGGYTTIPCQGTAEFTPTITGGYAPYNVQWSNGSQGADLSVSPLTNTVYSATVTDDCGTISVSQFVVDLEPVQPVVLSIIGSSTLLEACDQSIIAISRPQGVPGDLVISLNGTGDATPGADYELPGSALIPDGVDTIELPFAPFEDGLDDSEEVATIIATVTDACGRSADASVSLTIIDAAEILITGEDLLVPCANDSILSVVFASGGVGSLEITWSNGYEGPGAWLSTAIDEEYVVTATDDCGRTAQEFIRVDLICDVVIPNVISPNGDDYNETFFIEGLQFLSHTVRIYNRWGQMLLETSDYRNNWKAEGLPDGTYYYEVVVEDREKPYTGHITVLR